MLSQDVHRMAGRADDDFIAKNAARGFLPHWERNDGDVFRHLSIRGRSPTSDCPAWRWVLSDAGQSCLQGPAALPPQQAKSRACRGPRSGEPRYLRHERSPPHSSPEFVMNPRGDFDVICPKKKNPARKAGSAMAYKK